MKPTKVFVFLFSIGALLVAGLFYFSRAKRVVFAELVKPSQLDFAESNKIAEPVLVEIPVAAAEVEKPSEKKFSEADAQVWNSLNEVLLSKNDNDPRLNTDFNNMSVAVREALYEKYAAIPAENRNAKGTIVFLIARNLKSVADIEFVTKIYQEAPCLSLEDCKNVGPDDAHHSGVVQTTLVYPQLAGLYQIEQQLTAHPELLKNAVFRQGILNLLKLAEEFPVSVVQDKAREIRRRFGV